ncbi:hypothetical protein J4206_00805 [Candidatus Woesearchaeota archaeon]|nr:hypothetical protein [Candidatus Woesearchaeota archaeon]
MLLEEIQAEAKRIVLSMYERRRLPTITLYFSEEGIIPFICYYPDVGPELELIQKSPFPLNEKDITDMKDPGRSLAEITEMLYRGLLPIPYLAESQNIPDRDKRRVGLVSDGKRYDDLVASLAQSESKEINGMRFKIGVLQNYTTKAILYKISELKTR